MDDVVVAEAGLSRLKELLRSLERSGVPAKILPPADNCRSG